MQSPNDKHFESYLRQFHPIAPEPIPEVKARNAPRLSFATGTWVAAAAGIFIVGILIFHSRGSQIAASNAIRDSASFKRHTPSEPLTIRSATAWLAAAPSFETAVDDLAFRAKNISTPLGKQSAITVLGKE